jgi:hypothetical protein
MSAIFKCQKCDFKGTFAEMSDHEDNLCVYRVVACDYDSEGCVFQCASKDMDAHLENCAIAYLSQQCVKLSTEVEGVVAQNKELKRDLVERDNIIKELTSILQDTMILCKSLQNDQK